MLKVIYGGTIYVGFNAGEVIKAGQLVDIADGEAVVTKGDPIGIASVDVKVAGEVGAFRSALDRDTVVGEPLGIYMDGGVYETDQIAKETFAEGDALYVADGVLTKTKPTDGVEVGKVFKVKTGAVEFKLNL